MTKIAILPEPTELGDIIYRAMAGRQHSVGKTAGAALDALTATLSRADAATLVIVQHQRPDPFFTAAQQARLNELMNRWRCARDEGTTLPTTEQTELDDLVAAEVRAAGERTAALLKELEQ
jgi:hypothetical protein